MKNIITSGCSYSTNTGEIPYSSIIQSNLNVSVENKAWPGQSNKSIIKGIRDSIKSGSNNTTFICQLTHLHRLNLYCTLNEKYIDFQPMFINPIPEIKDGNIQFDIDIDNPHKGTLRGVGVYGASTPSDNNLPNDMYGKLWDFYQTYLKYFYDDTESFNSLMDDVDDLNRLVKSTNNKIIYLYWSHIIPNKKELQKRNFVNFNGEYSMLNWSTKNNLLDEIGTSHLSQDGHIKLAKKISNILNIKKNKII
jgi:hypothetical protein